MNDRIRTQASTQVLALSSRAANANPMLAAHLRSGCSRLRSGCQILFPSSRTILGSTLLAVLCAVQILILQRVARHLPLIKRRNVLWCKRNLGSWTGQHDCQDKNTTLSLVVLYHRRRDDSMSQDDTVESLLDVEQKRHRGFWQRGWVPQLSSLVKQSLKV